MRLTHVGHAVATIALGVALGAVLLAVPSTAHAAARPEITLTDRVDADAAYDVVEVTARAAARPGRPAVVVVRHARPVEIGDAVEVWFDLDNDQVPDLHLSGLSFSEYTVHRTRSFSRDGRDITEDDCVRLSMAGRTSKVRLYPECLDDPFGFAVSVRSSHEDGDEDTAEGEDDWAPREQRFSRRVLAELAA
jgi:hypothetical protein